MAHLRHEEKLNDGILDRVMTRQVPNADTNGGGPVHVPQWVALKGTTGAERKCVISIRLHAAKKSRHTV
jgi:hypothetical protein